MSKTKRQFHIARLFLCSMLIGALCCKKLSTDVKYSHLFTSLAPNSSLIQSLRPLSQRSSTTSPLFIPYKCLSHHPPRPSAGLPLPGLLPAAAMRPSQTNLQHLHSVYCRSYATLLDVKMMIVFFSKIALTFP